MKTTIKLLLLTIVIAISSCSNSYERFRTQVKTNKYKENSDYINQSAKALIKGNEKDFRRSSIKAKSSCPLKYKTYHNDAIFFRHKGLYKRAELASEIALKNGLNEGIILDTIYFEASQIAAKQKKYDQAISYLDLIKSPIANSQYNKGIFSLFSKNYDQAIEILEGEQDHNSLWALAIANFYVKNYDIALEKLEESNNKKSNPEVILAKAKVLSKIGKKNEAIKLLNELKKLKVTKDRAENYLASLLISVEKVEEAKKILPKLSNNTHHYDNLVCWGYIYMMESKFDTAYQLFTTAYKLDKNKSESIIGLGYSSLQLNRFDEAESWFRVALEVSDNKVSAYEGLGFVSYQNEKTSTALGYFNSAILISGLENLSYNGLLCAGYLNYYYNHIEDAKAILKVAINKSENNIWALVFLGYCYYEEDHYELAHSSFSEAYEKSPEIEILNCIGITETRLKMSDKAIKHLNEVLSKDSFNVFALNSLAFNYSHNNMHVEASETMSKVRSLDPYNREYIINSGMIETNYASYFIDKSLNDSVKFHLSKMNEFYSVASTMGSDNSVLNINKGYGYTMTENYDSALVFYNSVQNIFLEPSKINNIAVTNALRNDLQLAKNLFKDALVLLEEEPERKNDNLKKFINKNIEVTDLGSSVKDKKKNYFSSIYYYIFLDKIKPKFDNRYNLQYLDIDIKMPKEIYMDLIYTDKILCDCVYKTEIIVKKKSRAHKTYKNICPF
jgi:tetratricopeptide (TPR) repeat protein